jgi:hypothetical protein
MIYEIRDYYVEPTAMGAYEKWLREHALAYIRSHLDLVGFWVNTDAPVQVTGKALDDIGPATVTWVIRWADIDTRNRMMGAVFGPGAADWAEIVKHHPGRQHYRRIEARFARAL